MEMPNKTPRMMVHRLRGSMIVVVVLSWDRMMVRVGTGWFELVLVDCDRGNIVGGLVCERWRCDVVFCVLMVGD